MRNHLTDKASDAARFQQRLREILERVERDEIPRMDAGDMIGRQVVASLAPKIDASPAAAAVLFEAQCERTRLYLASSGATPLDAAESLVDAASTLDHFSAGEAERVRLIEPASRCLEDLIEIGSRSTAWSVVRVLLTSLMCTSQGKSLRVLTVERFAELLEASLEDDRHFDAFGFASLAANWALREKIASAERVGALLPPLLDKELDELDTATAIAGWRSIADRPAARPVFARLVRRLLKEGGRDLAARQIYRSFLEECPDEAIEMEDAFIELAHAHPDPALAYDADLDALNGLLCSGYGEDRAWPWQNRALLLRRKGDLAGALSALARVMMISGQPPELMGLLAPVVHQLGFEATARQFARFAPTEERRRFRLRVLDQLEAEPGTDSGLSRLITHLEKNFDDVEMPPEFRPAIRVRVAELQRRAGDWVAAEQGFRALFADEPTVELHAVRLAEAMFRNGRTREAQEMLEADFGARVVPHVRLLESYFAEAQGEAENALELTRAALAALDAAQRAGRENVQRAWLQIETRVKKDAGDEVVNGALLAMLQNEVHGARHRDLDELAPNLDRRIISLALERGDLDLAREVLLDYEAARPGDHEVHFEGLRAALSGDALDDARFFLDRLREAGAETGVECAVARALIAAREGDLDEAEETLECALEDDARHRARLALAALRAERGRGDEALVLLEAAGEPADWPLGFGYLKGTLLESAGRMDEAVDAYRQARETDEDAARRFGMLAIAHGGPKNDRDLINAGVEALTPFRDAEAVEAQGRGRALLATDAQAAAETLASFGKRMGEKGARRLALLEAHARLRSGDLAGLLELADRFTLTDELGDWIRKRRQFEALGTTDADDVGALFEISRTLEAEEDCAVSEAAAAMVARLGAPDDAPPILAEDAGDPLVLAYGLALAADEVDEGLAERLSDISGNGGPYAELAAAVGGLRDHEAPGALPDAAAWSDLAACFRAASPFVTADLLRGPAIAALREERYRDLDTLLAKGADADERLAGLRTIRLAIDRGDGAGLLHGLADVIAQDPDARWEDAQVTLKAHVTAARERPSPVWASARLRTAGKRSRVFVAGVLDYWRGVLEDETAADRGLARQHVALLELARAHEEEAAGREAPEPWLRAHEAWRALVADDAYWAYLGRRHDAEIVAAARRRLPRRLLDAHLRRAEFFLEAKKTAHAMRHARLAVGSPLADEELRPWLRDRIYRVFAPDVERLLARRDHVKALELLDRVLLADPDHGQARRELIDIAADSVARAFRVLDAFTRRPDPSTVLELAAGMREYLAVVENHVMDVAQKGRPQDPTLGESLACVLRGIAFLRFHREQNVAGASEAVELALGLIPEDHGLARKIRTFRSEVGMKRVAERLESGLSGDDPLQDSLAEVEALLADEPGSAELRRQKVRILVAMGQDESAEELAREVFAQAQEQRDPGAVREAIELLDAVQSGREALRRSTRLESLDRLVRDGNWRAAEQLYRELAIGQEDDPELTLRHVEILLGLRKARLARERLARLGGHAEVADRRRVLDARLACLAFMAAQGGDLYSAFELYERREFKRCQALLQMLPEVDARGAGARFLNAVCQSHLEDPERSAQIVEQARRRATEEDALWVLELLDMELAA